MRSSYAIALTALHVAAPMMGLQTPNGDAAPRGACRAGWCELSYGAAGS